MNRDLGLSVTEGSWHFINSAVKLQYHQWCD